MDVWMEEKQSLLLSILTLIRYAVGLGLIIFIYVTGVEVDQWKIVLLAGMIGLLDFVSLRKIFSGIKSGVTIQWSPKEKPPNTQLPNGED